MISVLFFAQLREALGVQKIEIPIDQSLSLTELLAFIIQKNPHWEQALTRKNLLMSINQELAQVDSLVRWGDEVAFFPPVTGG